MPVNYKIPRALALSLSSAAAELSAFVEAQREASGEMSERWQEGERAQSHEAWIGELETLAESLDSLPDFVDYL